MNLAEKYSGKTFVFHSPFESTPGWKDGDRGELVRLIPEGTEGVEEGVGDLWIGRNLGSGEEHQLWGGEAFTETGEPVIYEHAFTNWKPSTSRK